MRSLRVVINPPRLDDFLSVFQIQNPVLIEAFIAERAVETFDEGVLNRLARLNDAMSGSVAFQRESRQRRISGVHRLTRFASGFSRQRRFVARSS